MTNHKPPSVTPESLTTSDHWPIRATENRPPAHSTTTNPASNDFPPSVTTYRYEPLANQSNGEETTRTFTNQLSPLTNPQLPMANHQPPIIAAQSVTTTGHWPIRATENKPPAHTPIANHLSPTPIPSFQCPITNLQSSPPNPLRPLAIGQSERRRRSHPHIHQSTTTYHQPQSPATNGQ